MDSICRRSGFAECCFVWIYSKDVARKQSGISKNEFAKCSEDEIESSGYVVDTLEAAVWSLITTNTLEDALLKAVNLGDDADTVGAIAGELAGLYYGYERVPEEWRSQIVKEGEIVSLCEVVEEKFEH